MSTPTLTCADWCVSRHHDPEFPGPCLSPYQTVPATLHDPIQIVTAEGTVLAADTVRVATETEHPEGEPSVVFGRDGLGAGRYTRLTPRQARQMAELLTAAADMCQAETTAGVA